MRFATQNQINEGLKLKKAERFRCKCGGQFKCPETIRVNFKNVIHELPVLFHYSDDDVHYIVTQDIWGNLKEYVLGFCKNKIENEDEYKIDKKIFKLLNNYKIWLKCDFINMDKFAKIFKNNIPTECQIWQHLDFLRKSLIHSFKEKIIIPESLIILNFKEFPQNNKLYYETFLEELYNKTKWLIILSQNRKSVSIKLDFNIIEEENLRR
mgnify:CR=1 FL=1